MEPTPFYKKRGGVFLTLSLLFLMGSCGKTDSSEPTPSLPSTPPTYTITTTATIGGTITPQQRLPRGQTVRITATPDEHYQLQQWTGDCGSFTATKDCSLQASFEAIPYTLTATATPAAPSPRQPPKPSPMANRPPLRPDQKNTLSLTNGKPPQRVPVQPSKTPPSQPSP